MLQKEAVIRKREVGVGEEENEARIAQMKDWQRYTINTIMYNMKYTTCVTSSNYTFQVHNPAA